MSDVFVHESSYVDDGAEIGAGTKIWHFCHVMSGTRIGLWSFDGVHQCGEPPQPRVPEG